VIPGLTSFSFLLLGRQPVSIPQVTTQISRLSDEYLLQPFVLWAPKTPPNPTYNTRHLGRGTQPTKKPLRRPEMILFLSLPLQDLDGV
jgi:hypothetical protein